MAAIERATGGSNAWATPRGFVAGIAETLGAIFTLDLAATRETAVCERYYGPGGLAGDAFRAPWWVEAGTMWLNPPYSRTCLRCSDGVWKGAGWHPGEQCGRLGHPSRTIADWMRRACEAGTSGQRLAALVPARVDTAWFHRFVMGQAAVVYLVRGRLSFTLGTEALDPAPFPVLVAHYLGCAPAAHGGSTRFVAVGSDGRVEGESRQMALI